MSRMRSILVQATVLAMLSPLLMLPLMCQTPGSGVMASMACCRQMQSICMRGTEAGSLACCSQLRSHPVVACRVAGAATPAPAAVSPAVLPSAALADRIPAGFSVTSPPEAPPAQRTCLRI